MTATQMINDLGLSNRAYQVLYALGDTSSTVRTLEPGEAACIVGIVQDIYYGHPVTPLDFLLVGCMSTRMIEYVAEGGI